MIQRCTIRAQAFIIFMVTACALSAQSYTNAPGDSIVRTTTLGTTIVMNIIQRHPTNDTLHFHWKKLKVSLPNGWHASICDNGLCFGSLVDSGMMIPIVPGDDGLMSIHCTPDTTLGQGIIQYTLYEEKTAAFVDTLTWIVDVTPTGLLTMAQDAPVINYSTGNLSVRNTKGLFSCIELYDAAGRLLYQNTIDPYENSYLIDLPSNSGIIVNLKGSKANYSRKLITP